MNEKHSITATVNSISDRKFPQHRERESLVDCVRRLGSSASDAILDPATQIFRIPDIDGMIGYRIDRSCAVVYGDPLCHPEDWPYLVRAFDDHCRSRKIKIIYIAISKNFAHWASRELGGAILEFGEELFIDPHHDPKQNSGVYGSLVRRKVRHALKEGATIQEYHPPNQEIQQAIERVGTTWLNNRHGPQVHISRVRLFEDVKGKRWFYASHEGKVVGIVVLNQIQASQGWLLNHLMNVPDAPHGTAELLLTTALETVAKEGCHFVTFGSIVSEKLGEVKGLGRLTEWTARLVFMVVIRLLRLYNLRKFWAKFHPQHRGLYLFFNQPRIGFRELSSLMRALNVGLPKKGDKK